jgi:DNA-binding protein HU-beta
MKLLNRAPNLSRVRESKAFRSIGRRYREETLRSTRMNKGELTKIVADAAGLSQNDAGKAIDAVFEAIAGAVKHRKTVAIAGFGTFAPKTRNARTGRNPSTNEPIQIKEKTSLAFKPATAQKDI